MYDPKNPVENQEAEQAPEHGDEMEQVTEEEELEELDDSVADEQEEIELDDDDDFVELENRNPAEPVYGESYEEEFAAEAAAVPINDPMENDEEKETIMNSEVNPAMGWLGLTVSILSFFFAPLILGAAGIILGVVAKRQNADTLGNMAIIVSIISILFSLFFAPFYNFF
ncbi:hypothetical protein Q7A53_01600 [Halobacillus rhizosphaerae]|uniref:hypothetical protein n=1 Tax=Halobacillus rhizosphaerae TaxID=3064889 RepID=UPI00398BA195